MENNKKGRDIDPLQLNEAERGNKVTAIVETTPTCDYVYRNADGVDSNRSEM
jgi:hypothetical protein